MSRYKCGSEWSRWDLHIHTPENARQDNFTGLNPEEKWGNFYKSISEYNEKVSNKITVIGITDYVSIENYIKVINEREKLPESIKLILPNVEIRMTPRSKAHGINIHFIFNPVIVYGLNDRFFSRLKFSGKKREYSGTRQELIELGKSDDATIPDEKAYKIGNEAFLPSFENIKELFLSDTDLRDNTIILVSNNSTDGVTGADKTNKSFSEDNDDSFKKMRESIYHFADGILSSTDNDIKYFLGEKKGDEDIEERLGALKPCLHGSDAHDNEKIFEPNEKRYCWIKANPTFNGLKQVIWEPKERVQIGESIPVQKEKYNTIEKVRFIPKENTKKFSDDWIYLNSNLNAIIGGKSSGKSLLLYLIAKTTQSNGNFQDDNKYDLNVLDLDDFEVQWSDGRIDNYKSNEKKGILTYIPQFYLNELVEEKKKESELNGLIKNTLQSDDELKIKYSDFEKEKNEIEKNKNLLKLEIVNKLDEKTQIKEQMSEYQEEKILEASVRKKKAEIDKIKKDNGINDKQLEEEENLKEELKEIKAFRDKDIIDSFKVNINSKFRDTLLNFQNNFLYFNNPDFATTLDQEIKNEGEKIIENLKRDIENLNVKFNDDINQIVIKIKG